MHDLDILTLFTFIFLSQIRKVVSSHSLAGVEIEYMKVSIILDIPSLYIFLNAGQLHRLPRSLSSRTYISNFMVHQGRLH